MSTGPINQAGDSASRRLRALFCLLLLASAAVRLIALDADPPAWLSWSMGLNTDEGFYTLDARHEALFGHWASGNFHDRLLSPLLSGLQQTVFSAFGLGLVQARLISVVFGLLTICALFWGLCSAFNSRTALWGTVFFALLPPVIFYSRMALQETPTVFWLVLAFAFWSRGHVNTQCPKAWLIAAGISLAIAVIFKGLALVALPAFLFVAIYNACDKEDQAGSNRYALFVSVGVSLLLYAVLWYMPHRHELARMAAFYRDHQLLPHSLRSVWLNIRRGATDSQRGIAPYLLRLALVPCVLAAFAAVQRRLTVPDRLLALWLLCGLAFCFVSSYAPDRYYVLFYPALAGLAARGVMRLRWSARAGALTAFAAVSVFWVGIAWHEQHYARRNAAVLLTRTLPRGSRLVGEMAPALSVDTDFAAAPIQPGLSNDDRPVERLNATIAVVTREPSSLRWWREHEPGIVQPSRRTTTIVLSDRRHTIVDLYRIAPQ